jgi:hypothetical protein
LEAQLLKRGSVLIAVVVALLALAAAADARIYIAIDNVRSQSETLDGQPGSLSFDFTESGLPPGSESSYCFWARATVTTVGREFRPDSHGGRWFATMRRVDHPFGSGHEGPGACAYSAAADASGTAHGHFTSEFLPHLRMLPFLAQWTVSGIELADMTHAAYGFAGCPTTPSHYISNGCKGAEYRTYCNGFRTEFVETGAVPDLAECTTDHVSGRFYPGSGYQRPETPPEVLAAEDAAMSDALKLRKQLEECFAWRTRDYSACVPRITAASSGLPLGSARGQVEITEAQPPGNPGLPTSDSYTIVAHSMSGTDFTLYGKLWPYGLRYDTSCSKPHRGYCSPDGRWSDNKWPSWWKVGDWNAA